jgi:peptide/nickel transport system substrate-binding protein
MKKRRIFALLTSLALLLSACGDPTGTTVTKDPNTSTQSTTENTKTPAPAAAKTSLVTSDYFDPPPAVQANPFAPSNLGGMGEFVYDRLFEFVPLPQDTYFPLLAEKYENQGNKTTIYLKKDVKWSDGKPFTSKDVVSTYYMGYLGGWAMWQYCDSVEAPDDYTVVVNWKKEGFILAQMAITQQMHSPYHIYGKWADQLKELPAKRDAKNQLSKEDQAVFDKIREDVFKFKPQPTEAVGTGPYIVSNVTASEGVLSKNPNYREPQMIKIDEVKVQRYVSQEAYLSTVMSDGYDMEPHGLSPDVFEQIKAKNPNMKIIWTADLGQPSMQFNTARYPMNIPEVRKAVMCALNRDELKKVYEPGTEDPDLYSTGMSPLYVNKYLNQEFLGTLEKYSYDPAKADEYLRKIGWKKGGDGKYQNEKGEAVKIELSSMNSWPIFFLGGQAIVEQLKKFGFDAEFKPMELSAYWQYLDNGESMMSFDFRGNCQQFGFPWEAYRSLIIDSGNRIGLKTPVGQKINENAAKQDVVLNPDGTKTFRDGTGHIIYINKEGKEIDLNDTIDNMFYTTDPDAIKTVTKELARAANDLAILMPLGEKYAPMKVYDQNLIGYDPDNRTAPENYSYGMRVIGKMIRLGKLEYKQ